MEIYTVEKDFNITTKNAQLFEEKKTHKKTHLDQLKKLISI